MRHRRLAPIPATVAALAVATAVTSTPVAASSGSAASGSAASSGGPAVAAAKKCGKALWKCAPKRYHLTASGHRGPQTYSAEVDLERNRSNFANVQYSQRGGTLTVSTSYEGVPFEIDACSNARYVVSGATTRVPRAGLFGSFDFALFFFRKNVTGRWKYSVLGGGVYSELAFPGTVTCLEGDSAGASAPFTYYFHGPLGVGNPRFGKPGASGLSGSDAHGSLNSLRWKLTTK